MKKQENNESWQPAWSSKRANDKVMETLQYKGKTYIALASTWGIPCSNCCFQPCSNKPKHFPECPRTRNKYNENLYYRRLYNSQEDQK